MRPSRARHLSVVSDGADPGGGTVTVPLQDTGLEHALANLEQQLSLALEEGSRVVVLDMSGVVRVSSTTVAALLWTRRRCSSRGIDVQLRHASRRCLDALGRYGLTGVLAVEPTVDPSRRT